MPDQLHISVDLETLSTSTRAAIIAIGACAFDPFGDVDYREADKLFYANVDAQSCLDVGLEAEGSTIYWWLQQEQAARDALTNPPPMNIQHALVALSSWLNKLRGAAYLGSTPTELRIWAHENFDVPVLDSAHRACGYNIPWGHRDARDVRTVIADAEWPTDDKGRPQFGDLLGPNEMQHNALHDAVYQARIVQLSHKRMRALMAATPNAV